MSTHLAYFNLPAPTDLPEDEIRDLIDPATLDQIHALYPTAPIRAYVVAHEGEARPYQPTESGSMIQRVLAYPASTIRLINDLLPQSLPIYFGHPTTQDSPRIPIGRVIGKGLKTISGKLHSVVAAVLFPTSTPAASLDAASIEAAVTETDNGIKLDAITGLALSNMAKGAIPAFPGARFIGSLHHFLDDPASSDSQFNPTQIKETPQLMERDEIIAAVKKARIKPEEIFADADIASAPAAKAQASQISALQSELEKAQSQEQSLTARVKELSPFKVRHDAARLLPEVLSGRELDDTQRRFIESRVAKFTPNGPTSDHLSDVPTDAIRDELAKFIDAQLGEFDDFSNLLGTSRPKPVSPGLSPGKETPTQDADFTNPEVNDFIPTVK